MNGEGKKGMEVFMWGYLPGATPQRSPLLVPTAVKLAAEGDGWEGVCGGGCGFAMAISGTLVFGVVKFGEEDFDC